MEGQKSQKQTNKKRRLTGIALCSLMHALLFFFLSAKEKAREHEKSRDREIKKRNILTHSSLL